MNGYTVSNVQDYGTAHGIIVKLVAFIIVITLLPAAAGRLMHDYNDMRHIVSTDEVETKRASRHEDMAATFYADGKMDLSGYKIPMTEAQYASYTSGNDYVTTDIYEAKYFCPVQGFMRFFCKDTYTTARFSFLGENDFSNDEILSGRENAAKILTNARANAFKPSRLNAGDKAKLTTD